MNANDLVAKMLENEDVDWTPDPTDPDASTRIPDVHYYEIYVGREHEPEDDFDAPRDDDGFSTYFKSLTPPDCEVTGDCNVGRKLKDALAREALALGLIEPQDLVDVGYVAPVTREAYEEFNRVTGTQ